MSDNVPLDQVGDLFREAQRLSRRRKTTAAIRLYQQALALLGPEPLSSDYACSIYYGLGEIYRETGRLDQALDFFSLAVRSPGGLGAWPIHLRLGQVRYERSEWARAEDELMRAYMDGGDEAFEGEDPKYYALIAPYLTPGPPEDAFAA